MTSSRAAEPSSSALIAATCAITASTLSPFGLEATDLLAQAVALALQVFGAGLQRLALVLQRREGGHIEVGLGVFALLKACNDGVEVFTEGEDV
jgi:hypothetical protein